MAATLTRSRAWMKSHPASPEVESILHQQDSERHRSQSQARLVWVGSERGVAAGHHVSDPAWLERVAPKAQCCKASACLMHLNTQPVIDLTVLVPSCSQFIGDMPCMDTHGVLWPRPFEHSGTCPTEWFWLTFGDSGSTPLRRGMRQSIQEQMHVLKIPRS
jgi:hypothetical protein